MILDKDKPRKQFGTDLQAIWHSLHVVHVIPPLACFLERETMPPAAQQQPPAHNALLRVNQIIGNPKKGIPAIIPISRSGWWAGVRDGRFPKPVKLAPRTTVWHAADVYALIEKTK